MLEEVQHLTPVQLRLQLTKNKTQCDSFAYLQTHSIIFTTVTHWPLSHCREVSLKQLPSSEELITLCARARARVRVCVTKACGWAISDGGSAGAATVCGTSHLK